MEFIRNGVVEKFDMWVWDKTLVFSANKLHVNVVFIFFFFLFDLKTCDFQKLNTKKKKKKTPLMKSCIFLVALQREWRLWKSVIRVWKKTGSEVCISASLAVRTAPLPLGDTASIKNNTAAEKSGVTGTMLTGDVCVCLGITRVFGQIRAESLQC